MLYRRRGGEGGEVGTSVCRPSQYKDSGVYVCACGSTRGLGSEKGPLRLAEGARPSSLP